MAKELLRTFFVIQQGYSGISHLWASIDLWNQENIIIVFQSMIKAKESEGKHSFGKNIIFEIVPTIFLILINILFALFSYLFC